MTSTSKEPKGDGEKGGKGGGRGSRRRLQDYFLQNKGTEIDYKNGELMRRFLSPEGKILPSRRTGLTSKNQRKITKAIKRARSIGLLPYTNHDA